MVYTVKIEPHPDDKNRYTEEKQYRADQLDIMRQQVGLGWWLNVISGIGGGIAFLALLALCYNAYVVQQQRDTMERQLKVMVNQDRPWVTIDNTGDKGIVPYAPLSVDKGIANFPLRIALKNSGRSPARVNIGAEVVDIHHDQGETLAKEVDRVCAKSPAYSWPAAIAPTTMTFNHVFQFPLKGDTKKIEPTIVGCIWYEATTGDTALRNAPFSGQITQANDEKGAPVEAPKTLPILLRGNSVPIANWKVVDVLMKGTPN